MIDLFLDPTPAVNYVDLTDGDPRVRELHRCLTEAQATYEANIQELNKENQNLKVLLEERRVALMGTNSDLTETRKGLETQIGHVKTLERQVKSSREHAAELQIQLQSQIDLVDKLRMTVSAYEFLQVPRQFSHWHHPPPPPPLHPKHLPSPWQPLVHEIDFCLSPPSPGE
jgi:hypothetical protein